MDIIIKPGRLDGSVRIPSSKSLCHRAVISAGLSSGTCRIENVMQSKDIEATIESMRTLGVQIRVKGDTIEVESTGKLIAQNNEINCNESGSTLRFLIPPVLLQGEEVTFTGKGRLMERPLEPYFKVFEMNQIEYSGMFGKPLTLKGKLKPGKYEIPGNISSQFISGLFFALPLLEGDSEIVLTTELESKAYVDMTIDTLKKFSVQIENREYKQFNIKGNQSYKAVNYTVEGDFSQAAFWFCSGAINGNIKCTGLNLDSLQGDKVILDILNNFGVNLNIGYNEISAVSSVTKGTIIDASQCPDLVPVLAVIGALSHGRTEIINAQRLRIKESDRLKAIATELNKLGAKVTEHEDSLSIDGVENLTGGEVDSWNDHRIAMALSIASLKCTEPVILKGSECVQKSYPAFFEDFKKLGGIVHERKLG